jgi:hypothetical protein
MKKKKIKHEVGFGRAMAKQVLVSRVIRRMHKRKEKFKRKKKQKHLNMKSSLEQPWLSNFKCQKLFNKCKKK